MSALIVESYKNTTINTILDDIHKKYIIDTRNEHISPDLPIKDIKFKYRTYSECVRMLYKNAGLYAKV